MTVIGRMNIRKIQPPMQNFICVQNSFGWVIPRMAGQSDSIFDRPCHTLIHIFYATSCEAANLTRLIKATFSKRAATSA